MKRGISIIITILAILAIMPSAFSLSSIGYEKNLTPENILTSSTQSIRCLQFQTIEEQIQCRLASTNLVPIQSVFCAETVESEWCEQLLVDAKTCFALNGTEKDVCFTTYANSYSVLEYTQGDSYILFLLLDLIQGVEEDYDAQKLTIRESSFLIEKLVNLGQAVMRHEPNQLISILFSEYIYFWENYTQS